jgi:hypothetical protein
VDLDLDGRVDVVVVNGSTQEEKGNPLDLLFEPMFIFWSDGARFHDVAPSAGEASAGKYWARGLAAADYDGDGDVDLAVSINRGQPLLLRNDTPTSNLSLAVRLQADAVAAFGAKVDVVTSRGRQTRWGGGDVTYLGMHDAEMIFGLGPDAVAERVHVLWSDGEETSLENVPAGRVTIHHPDV